jgi:hypothetical protein
MRFLLKSAKYVRRLQRRRQALHMTDALVKAREKRMRQATTMRCALAIASRCSLS